MKWMDISTIHGALLEQAKVEALRKIAEELEQIRQIMEQQPDQEKFKEKFR